MKSPTNCNADEENQKQHNRPAKLERPKKKIDGQQLGVLNAEDDDAGDAQHCNDEFDVMHE